MGPTNWQAGYPASGDDCAVVGPDTLWYSIQCSSAPSATVCMVSDQMPTLDPVPPIYVNTHFYYNEVFNADWVSTVVRDTYVGPISFTFASQEIPLAPGSHLVRFAVHTSAGQYAYTDVNVVVVDTAFHCARDSDGDGVVDCGDNCPHVANSGQDDANADGHGDTCDPTFESQGGDPCPGDYLWFKGQCLFVDHQEVSAQAASSLCPDGGSLASIHDAATDAVLATLCQTTSGTAAFACTIGVSNAGPGGAFVWQDATLRNYPVPFDPASLASPWLSIPMMPPSACGSTTPTGWSVSSCDSGAKPFLCSVPGTITVTLLGDAVTTIVVGNFYIDVGALATHTYEGPLSQVVSTTPALDTSSPGTYERTYVFTSASGVQANATRTIVVVIDNCPADPDKLEPGVCGCGVADRDSDGDAVLDCNDLCPHIAGAHIDSDSDGLGDDCDPDTDGLGGAPCPAPYLWFEGACIAASHTATDYVGVTCLGGGMVAPILYPEFNDAAWHVCNMASAPCWIGLRDTVGDGSFEWTSGAPLSYSNFASGELGGGVGDCAAIAQHEQPAMWGLHECTGHGAPTYHAVCALGGLTTLTLLGDDPMLVNTAFEVYVDPGAVATNTYGGMLSVSTFESDSAGLSFNVDGSYTVLYEATTVLGEVVTAVRSVTLAYDECPSDENKEFEGDCGCGVPETPDSDGDGWVDCLDNCPHAPNEGQQDSDANGTGDACDVTTAPGAVPCPVGFVWAGGICYATAPAAPYLGVVCPSGSSLVSIHSDLQQSVVRAMCSLAGASTCWIGLGDDVVEGSPTWSDGTVSQYTHFSPTASFSESCAVVDSTDPGYWDTSSCLTSLVGVCMLGGITTVDLVGNVTVVVNLRETLYNELGATGSNTFEGAAALTVPDPEVDDEEAFFANTPGTYTLTYSAKSASGRIGFAMRAVTLVYTPEFTMNLQPILDVEVDEDTDASVPLVVDIPSEYAPGASYVFTVDVPYSSGIIDVVMETQTEYDLETDVIPLGTRYDATARCSVHGDMGLTVLLCVVRAQLHYHCYHPVDHACARARTRCRRCSRLHRHLVRGRSYGCYGCALRDISHQHRGVGTQCRVRPAAGVCTVGGHP